jgi:hypothetical protein
MKGAYMSTRAMGHVLRKSGQKRGFASRVALSGLAPTRLMITAEI